MGFICLWGPPGNCPTCQCAKMALDTGVPRDRHWFNLQTQTDSEHKYSPAYTFPYIFHLKLYMFSKYYLQVNSSPIFIIVL